MPRVGCMLVWVLSRYEGAPLQIFVTPGVGEEVRILQLGPVDADGTRPQAVSKAPLCAPHPVSHHNHSHSHNHNHNHNHHNHNHNHQQQQQQCSSP
jgi:hypothetical protein